MINFQAKNYTNCQTKLLIFILVGRKNAIKHPESQMEVHKI